MAGMKPTHYLHIRRDRAGEYRWHVRARNGRIVADSGEGYKTPAGCLKGFRSLVGAVLKGRVDYGKYHVVSDD